MVSRLELSLYIFARVDDGNGSNLNFIYICIIQRTATADDGTNIQVELLHRVGARSKRNISSGCVYLFWLFSLLMQESSSC